MKAYGMKRKDVCDKSNHCLDRNCIDHKYRLMRGKSRKHRKNALKVPKSAERFKAKCQMMIF